MQKKGYDTTKKRYLLSELEALCQNMAIPLTVDEPQVKPGWMNKPKGMLQILYERGWINTAIPLSTYTKTGRKEDFDEEKNLMEDGKIFCLTYLLENCGEFKNKLTALEHLAMEISSPQARCSILFTPKFHCELAGEGIKYSWGASKWFYCKQSLQSKKNVKQFFALIKKSIQTVNTQMTRHFVGKARSYMLAYKHMMMENEPKKVSTSRKDSEKKELKEKVRIKIEKSFEYTEKICKTYRLHCDANVTHGSFIEQVMKESIMVE